MHNRLDRIAGNTIIQFTDIDPALLKVDAIVEEQDTDLLLGKSPVVMNTIESFSSLVNKMERQVREIPGSVIIKATKPKRFIAIVYDIESDPICKIIWLKTVLNTILADCEQYRIKTLAMPLLGTSFGNLEGDSVIALLHELFVEKRSNHLKKVIIYQ